MLRRHALAGLAIIALALPAAARQRSDDGVVKGRKGGPNMIKGDPPRLDFGGGLLIPMNASIFKTLWEGEDRWVTYGRSVARQETRAMQQAEVAATGTMKLMLLTQAFAPERLVRFETCGWRGRTGDAKDLVLGEIALPGRPVMPTTDRVNGAATGAETDGLGEDAWHAVTGYMVMKKDVTLADVKARAQLIEG
ncbi:hypothetical protein DMC25_26260 [Caulobacter sp. D4A]|uniref:hypothetical protein n=1 Tax=unclassified Caulobacter TaxID=2648921 RepID=UPI000D73B268|nr:MULTISPECIES: hypothetical protein [unclassified Caulobacter]PXA73372.1 hypothetical protein DMC25_26260 [Caulobacter sp. D4A]PXA86384.1 hypothetical protein DMC18_22035 [Caulobacter sp. D5]